MATDKTTDHIRLITTHLFEDKYLHRYKRIETKDGIKWRKSVMVGEWLAVVDDYLYILENIYKKHLYNLRENKLNRIIK